MIKSNINKTYAMRRESIEDLTNEINQLEGEIRSCKHQLECSLSYIQELESKLYDLRVDRHLLTYGKIVTSIENNEIEEYYESINNINI